MLKSFDEAFQNKISTIIDLALLVEEKDSIFLKVFKRAIISFDCFYLFYLCNINKKKVLDLNCLHPNNTAMILLIEN